MKFAELATTRTGTPAITVFVIDGDNRGAIVEPADVPGGTVAEGGGASLYIDWDTGEQRVFRGFVLLSVAVEAQCRAYC